MTDAVALAELRARELPNAVLLDQFTSAANPEIHRRTTAEETGTEPVAGQHQVPGIGVGFIPAVLNRSILDGSDTVE